LAPRARWTAPSRPARPRVVAGYSRGLPSWCIFIQY
jgi:hypothetical protein